MNSHPGVYVDHLKNGQANYRASLTWKNKHISLGSFKSPEEAGNAYDFGHGLLNGDRSLWDYEESFPISYEKYVVLVNLRENGIYIQTPVYLEKTSFLYCLTPKEICKFDLDDLFYFSSHKIMKRGGHLFVSEYGMQTSVKERFGIRPFSVEGRDYRFINGDFLDFRRENIDIINRYTGVTKIIKNTVVLYQTTVHVNGNIIVGRYETETEAAIAYNKAVDLLKASGCKKKYSQNFIDGVSNREYAEIYSSLPISEKLTQRRV